MGTFSADIQKWVETVGGDADQVVRGTVVQIVNAVDEASPVGNPSLWKNPPPKGYVGGRFRANNQLGVDVMYTGTIPTPDPSGSKTVSANLSRIPDEAAGHVYWLSNSLPYARRLEYDHWSSQAPAGIYSLVTRDFNRIVEQEAAKVRS